MFGQHSERASMASSSMRADFSLKFLMTERDVRCSFIVVASFMIVSFPILEQYSNLKYFTYLCVSARFSMPSSEMLCWNKNGLPPSSRPYKKTMSVLMILKMSLFSLLFLNSDKKLILGNFFSMWLRISLSSFTTPDRFKYLRLGHAWAKA